MSPPSPAPQESIILQWHAPLDNGSPITSYRLERDDGAGGDFQVVYAGPNTTTMVSGLRSGFRYLFKVLAENDVRPGAQGSGFGGL